jgi:hypothetical protein
VDGAVLGFLKSEVMRPTDSTIREDGVPRLNPELARTVAGCVSAISSGDKYARTTTGSGSATPVRGQCDQTRAPQLFFVQRHCVSGDGVWSNFPNRYLASLTPQSICANLRTEALSRGDQG